MRERILITGGAGFVGSHLADRLLREGYRVRLLDNLSEQVHGSSRSQPQGEERAWPDYLDARVERVIGDIRDAAKVTEALQGVSAVFHLAAAVGVGQSMYRIEHYTDVNNRGTAILLEALSRQPVDKLVVASSMSLYGEGLYRDSAGREHTPRQRDSGPLKLGQWDIHRDGELLQPLPTPETKPPFPSSVYALSKFDQERLCLMVGAAYGVPTTALRFFNIYGPRQALSNPYTGVLAIFSSRLLNNKPPIIFEDGQQRRDFVSVHDITRACVLAMENSAANGQVFNIGSGGNYSISDIATKLSKLLRRPGIEPHITGQYRVGDIRHCFADIGKASALLGYRPQVTLDDGLLELAEWLRDQRAVDGFDAMRHELASRGLSR